MHIRISIPDIVCATLIGTASWFADGHAFGPGILVAGGAFALGRLTQWILGQD